MFGKKKTVRLENPLLVAFFDEEEALNVRIDVDQLQEPGWAGIVLADLEQHFAGALAHAGKAASPEEALAAIRETYLAEIANPTDTPTGHIEN